MAKEKNEQTQAQKAPQENEIPEEKIGNCYSLGSYQLPPSSLHTPLQYSRECLKLMI